MRRDKTSKRVRKVTPIIVTSENHVARLPTKCAIQRGVDNVQIYARAAKPQPAVKLQCLPPYNETKSNKAGHVTYFLHSSDNNRQGKTAQTIFRISSVHTAPILSIA